VTSRNPLEPHHPLQRTPVSTRPGKYNAGEAEGRKPESTNSTFGIFFGGLAGAVFTLTVQSLIRWWKRPSLVLLPYEHRPPMYRLAPDVKTGTKTFYVNVGVRNRGRIVAERCRAVITAVEELKQDRWLRDRNWLPLDLMWGHYKKS
jgi:hypothetical protein